jgi:2-oxoisovalerate dehydrogenase E2 component (dihydrolipoyl transacylase)
MSEYVVKLPDVGEGIAEAEIVEWHVAVGDVITEDQVMVDVMTDKATVELPSPVSGTVVSLGAAAGEVLAVGAALVTLDIGGGAAEPPAAAPSATEPVVAAPVTAVPATAGPVAGVSAAVSIAAAPVLPLPSNAARNVGAQATASRPQAAPAVRQRAHALGIDLADVAGSGPDGRVGHADLDRHVNRQGQPTLGHQLTSTDPDSDGVSDAESDDGSDEFPVIGLRRNIAQRMQLAKRRIPHFTYVDEVDVTEVERLRAELNDSGDGVRLTLLPFLMRAVVRAIGDFPQMNARYDDDNDVVRRHHAIHLGIATQTAKGLMVPVVKHAERRDLWQCAAETARLAEAARTSKITIAELGGSTITITSLGALGGIVSTPIINSPEVAIIGVNKIATRPVYIAGGAIVPRQIMNLSSSFDHRIIDGADAAAFVQRIRQLLETPALLFTP